MKRAASTTQPKSISGPRSGPNPLTQCQAPALDWSRPDTPAASNFGDIYFSVDGGVEETRTVFLNGCGLPDAWSDRSLYTIGELGFGSGLNFLAAWQMWDDTHHKPSAAPPAYLHFISIEKYPFDTAQLQQALSAWPELAAYAQRLIAAWPARVKGFHRLNFGSVTLTLIHDDVNAALDGIDAQIDAWFLDGFSPEKNPDMWSADIMRKIKTLSAPKARLATFTVAGAVRMALREAGFAVEKKPGFGRKRHRLEARCETQGPIDIPPKTRRAQPVIIGTGIGGASLARAFLRRGITPKIITRGHRHAASTNAAALIKPRLDLQDRPESRFFLAAYLYALRLYEDINADINADINIENGGIISRSVSQLAKTDKEAERFEKIARQAPLPDTQLTYENGALSLPQSLVISPKHMIEAMIFGAEIENCEVQDLDALGGPVFAAMGYDIKSVLGGQDPELRYSRGQLSWALPDRRLTMPVSYGGYALNLGGRVLLGATHDRIGKTDPYSILPADDLRNFAQFETVMGYRLKPDTDNARSSRASVRVTTANTLPMVLNPQPERFILTGLGSRGFVYAPLLAEAIVCRWLGEPLPIDKALWAKLGPR